MFVKTAIKKIVSVLLLTYSTILMADLAPEPLGVVEKLPTNMQNSWFWATDPLLRRLTLTDFRDDRSLGTLDGGQMLTIPLFPIKNYHEFYVPETHYSRGSRGERIDIITIYDTQNLKPTDEVIIPPKRAINSLPIGNAALSDDEQFIAIFNMTPAQSLSIIDIRSRHFVTEIETPGCSLAYPAGDRRFMMLCGDGRLLFVKLKRDGTLDSKTNSEKVFDSQVDPITEKAVRYGKYWLFVSFEGYVYAIDVSSKHPEKLSASSIKPWPLLNDEERNDNWRVGGRQFIAVHEQTNRLYVLLHQGTEDTHKDGGTELWVYDMTEQKKINTVELQSPGITFTGVGTEFGTDWIWPFNNLYNSLTRLSFAEPHARPDSIVITQESSPTLLLSGQFTGMVAVYDALTLELQHRVTTGNISNLALLLPHWGNSQKRQQTKEDR